MATTDPRVVCISGSLAPGARTTRIAARCAALASTLGAEATVVTGAELDFPFYRPGGQRPAAVARFLSLLESADGVVLVSPTYHGTVSGLLKNALDYVNDLDSVPRPFLDGRPVGCVAVSAGTQGASSTLVTLRTIVHALRGWPTPLGVAACGDAGFDADGEPAGALPSQLRELLAQVMTMASLHARRRQRQVAQPAPVATLPN